MSMTMLFWGRRKQVKSAARALYEVAVGQARDVAFYQTLSVADSLDGRFDVLALHVFLILHRLGREGRATRALGQALFDLMFADMDESLRELGASDISMSRRIKTMVKAFFGRIAAYERGLTDSAAMKDALERNLYRGGTVEPAVVAAMERYLRLQAESLAAQPLADLEAGVVIFGPPELP